ncbi:MAG TPA: enoyl-CoA hydratase-related protein [Rhizomicrobium sp.]|nr:enoyl-CoA hydratase-related protein [Rhizomicrobium sp.]
MEYEHIVASANDRVLTLTLNRPDKLNAYTAQMGAELAHAFEIADNDDDIRVVIVTGAGRGFCAGADISAGAGAFDTGSGKGSHLFGSGIDTSQRRAGGFVEAIYKCRKPSIAAINGPAVGVGITLALPMDIRIAADSARFGFVFARRGLVPEAGSAWFLPRIVGFSQAMRWCLSGKLFDAKEALAGGLISESVAPDTLLDRASEIAREIADETSAISIALTRQMLWRYAGEPDPFELLKIDGPLSVELGGTADVKEGVSAFLEKRKPKFPGRVSKDMPTRFPFRQPTQD